MPADTGISDELSEKILGYVEREAGRDWPLSPEDEAMVRDLLEKDPAAQALADGFRRSNANLDAMFDTTAVSVPDELVAMIRAHGARRSERAGGTDEVGAAPTSGEVVSFPPEPTAKTWSYGPLAAAASLALVVAVGALVYNIRAQDELERTVAELENERQTQQVQIETQRAETGSLDEQLDVATAARREAEMAFTAASGDVARLGADLSAVTAALDEAEQSLTSVTADLEGAQGLNADLEQQLTALEQEASQTEAQAAAERNRLQQEAADLGDQLAAALDAQGTAEAGLAAANSTVADLIEAGSTLNQEVAALQEQAEAFETELAARSEQLTEAETALAQAQRQAAGLATERETLVSRLAEEERSLADLASERGSLAAEVEEAEQALAVTQDELTTARNQSVAFQTALEMLRQQTGWLAQVAGYHIGYAGKPREVEVKVDGDDRQALLKAAQGLSNWLSNELGREIKIPLGLPMEGGLDFVGGRVLPTISGTPVGQIAYHDDQGRLTAFCLKRNPTGVVQDLERRRFFDQLQMIHWQDEDFQYVVVGFADFEALKPVAEWLKSNYGDDI